MKYMILSYARESCNTLSEKNGQMVYYPKLSSLPYPLNDINTIPNNCICNIIILTFCNKIIVHKCNNY